MSKTIKKPGYVGKAGHLAVMGEFAIRGYNVAMPEVDYGDDIFVTQDDSAKLWRIQVKTATPTKSKAVNPRSERFQVAAKETFLLNNDDNPPVYIVFAMRSSKSATLPLWRFLVIERKRLAEYYNDNQVGQKNNANVKFDVSIHHDGKHKGKVIVSQEDLTKWMEKWDAWPVLDHA